MQKFAVTLGAEPAIVELLIQLTTAVLASVRRLALVVSRMLVTYLRKAYTKLTRLGAADLLALL